MERKFSFARPFARLGEGFHLDIMGDEAILPSGTSLLLLLVGGQIAAVLERRCAFGCGRVRTSRLRSRSSGPPLHRGCLLLLVCAGWRIWRSTPGDDRISCDLRQSEKHKNTPPASCSSTVRIITISFILILAQKGARKHNLPAASAALEVSY